MPSKKEQQPKKITAEELDRKFDAGEDVSEYFDFTKARRLNPPSKQDNNKAPL